MRTGWMKKWFLIFLSFIPARYSLSQSPDPVSPGWTGETVLDCETLRNWSVEKDAGTGGSLEIEDGFVGKAVRLNWDLNSGEWVQAKYTFPIPVDLSEKDIFGLSLKGSAGTANRISLMFADRDGVFFGLDCDGLSAVSRWMINLSFPKKMFYYFFTIPPRSGSPQIDWSRIDRFFVAVKRPAAGSGGGKGRMTIDQLQADLASGWTRPDGFESAATDTAAAGRAIRYLMDQQKSTGLLQSWKEEPDPRAYLYDEALALIALTREGEWNGRAASNAPAGSAERLAAFMLSSQKPDGHWARAWNPSTGRELADDQWIGDQAWAAMALWNYASKSGNTSASAPSRKIADWLAARVDASGSAAPSTEGTVDAWWAMVASNRMLEADRIRQYLLTKVWDPDLKYWWRGNAPDPVIAMDCAAWMSEFARSPMVRRPDMALAALGFVRRTLITTDDSGLRVGFDGMGPLSVWCEGTAQFVSAGGPDAPFFLNQLLSLQKPDGGMPCSPDNWSGTGFGWLSSLTGIAPTAWLYFALTRPPFAEISDFAGEVEDAPIRRPEDIRLSPVFPNPFNPGAQLCFILRKPSHVSLTVLNSNGERMATLMSEYKSAGSYRVFWNAASMTSGLYLICLQADARLCVEKCMLLK